MKSLRHTWQATGATRERWCAENIGEGSLIVEGDEHVRPLAKRPLPPTGRQRPANRPRTNEQRGCAVSWLDPSGNSSL